MLRHGRLLHLEDLDQRVNVEFPTIAVGKLFDDANPTFMAESAESFRQLFGNNDSCRHIYLKIF